MNMKNRLFDKLYKAAEAVLDATRKPYREKAICRAFEELGDRYAMECDTVEAKLVELRHKLANAADAKEAESIIRTIAETRLEIADVKAFCEIVNDEETIMFSEASE